MRTLNYTIILVYFFFFFYNKSAIFRTVPVPVPVVLSFHHFLIVEATNSIECKPLPVPVSYILVLLNCSKIFFQIRHFTVVLDMLIGSQIGTKSTGTYQCCGSENFFFGFGSTKFFFGYGFGFGYGFCRYIFWDILSMAYEHFLNTILRRQIL
jgi:hypothetical protein